MRHFDLLKSVPPMKYFIPTDMTFGDFVHALDRLFSKFNSRFIHVMEFIGDLSKKKEVKHCFMYGSAVYRIKHPDDITDIDIMIVSKDVIPRIAICPPSERFHIHIRSEHVLDSICMFPAKNKYIEWEVCAFAGELLVFKSEEGFDELLTKLREVFEKNYFENLVSIVLWDMYKIVHNLKVTERYFSKTDIIREKAEKVKMYVEDSSVLSIRKAFEQGGFTDKEMYRIAMAAMRRRRINYKYRKMLIDETVRRLTERRIALNR